MYHIIGADGKSYGPATAEQVQQWIREGRANGTSQVQAVGSLDWNPIATVPELAEALGSGGTAPPPMPPLSANATIASRASNKLAAGICGILLGTFGVHKFILGYTRAGLIMLLVTLLTCGFAGIVMSIIGLIEGIVYLSKSDEEFVRIYVDGRKEWF